MLIVRSIVTALALAGVFATGFSARAADLSGAQLFHNALFGPSADVTAAPTPGTAPIVSGADTYHARLTGEPAPSTMADNVR